MRSDLRRHVNDIQHSVETLIAWAGLAGMSIYFGHSWIFLACFLLAWIANVGIKRALKSIIARQDKDMQTLMTARKHTGQ